MVLRHSKDGARERNAKATACCGARERNAKAAYPELANATRKQRHVEINKKGRLLADPSKFMERTTGFEPATPTLARWCSTN